MKKSGFTLVELVTVIIILSTLMVFVAPKVVDLQSSAKVATLQSISAAMNGAIKQVKLKAWTQGLTQDPENPAGAGKTMQTGYLIDFGIGAVEVDWATLCPESKGEAGDAMTMLDFIDLSTNSDLTTAIGNRHTVIGYKHAFTPVQLKESNLTTLPSGCYVIYDSFGGRPNGTNDCPSGGCQCTVRVVKDDC